MFGDLTTVDADFLAVHSGIALVALHTWIALVPLLALRSCWTLRPLGSNRPRLAPFWRRNVVADEVDDNIDAARMIEERDFACAG